MAQVQQHGVAFAKTTRPVIGSAVRREALFARIDGTPGRTVIWISGPPGAGKSTLAASYVEARALASFPERTFSTTRVRGSRTSTAAKRSSMTESSSTIITLNGAPGCSLICLANA